MHKERLSLSDASELFFVFFLYPSVLLLFFFNLKKVIFVCVSDSHKAGGKVTKTVSDFKTVSELKWRYNLDMPSVFCV